MLVRVGENKTPHSHWKSKIPGTSIFLKNQTKLAQTELDSDPNIPLYDGVMEKIRMFHTITKPLSHKYLLKICFEAEQ